MDFKEIIKAHLDKMASQDFAFAERYKNEKKSLDECCKYIMAQAKKKAKGNCAAIEDAVVYGWAVHYYQEDDVKVEEVKAKVTTPKADKPAAPKAVTNGRGTVNLGYATYSGELRNGKPDGAGVMTFKSSHKAGRNFKTGEDVFGEPGETVDGVFSNGFLQVGTISKKDGNVIKIKY